MDVDEGTPFDPGDFERIREHRRALTGTLEFTLRTYVPEKYVLIDTETRDIWGFRVAYDGIVRTRRIYVEADEEGNFWPKS